MNNIELSDKHFKYYNYFKLKAKDDIERYDMYINEAQYHLTRANHWSKTYLWQKQRDRYNISIYTTYITRMVYLKEIEE